MEIFDLPEGTSFGGLRLVVQSDERVGLFLGIDTIVFIQVETGEVIAATATICPLR
jgi:hypothetical protein